MLCLRGHDEQGKGAPPRLRLVLGSGPLWICRCSPAGGQVPKAPEVLRSQGSTGAVVEEEAGGSERVGDEAGLEGVARVTTTHGDDGTILHPARVAADWVDGVPSQAYGVRTGFGIGVGHT